MFYIFNIGTYPLSSVYLTHKAVNSVCNCSFTEINCLYVIYYVLWKYIKVSAIGWNFLCDFKGDFLAINFYRCWIDDFIWVAHHMFSPKFCKKRIPKYFTNFATHQKEQSEINKKDWLLSVRKFVLSSSIVSINLCQIKKKLYAFMIQY